MLTKFKFDENGEITWFPGNTIVSNLYMNKNVVQAIQTIQEKYKNLPFSDKFSFMPKGSIHMTVFELLCHFNRASQYWCNDLSLNETLENIDTYFNNKLVDYEFISGFEMKAVDITPTSIHLKPMDVNVELLLEKFRNHLSRLTGVRFPNHNTYQFHISFGYLLEELTEQEQQIIENLNAQLNEKILPKLNSIYIEKIEFTIFEDMSEFIPYTPEARLRLRERKGYNKHFKGVALNE